MAYDEGIAERLREVYAEVQDIAKKKRKLVEKKMFGGLAFMVDGHMSCGVVKDELMVRVGPDRFDEALRRPYARKMDFTGKPLKGFVYVEPEGYASDQDLQTWVKLSLEFVATLPPK